ncbi:MAG: SRPBCC family protein [Gemmatimonadota bacterium]
MSFTHEHSCKLAAAPRRVFVALTAPDEMTQWFAEHVEVGQGVGEPYRFWGRHSLDTPTVADASQRLLRYERDRALSFAWTLGRVPTEVTITLNADAESTRVVLHHAVNGELDRPRAKALIDDHWRLAFGNLAAHLAGDGGVALPDYADPAPRIRQVVLIDAPREVVVRCLIEPALINQWFGTSTSSVEPRVGGRYSVNWQYEIEGRQVQGGPTRILELVPDRRLVLDWPDWRGDASVAGQTISFELESVGAATRLTFVHAGFDRAADMSDYPFGWRWFLGELTKVALKVGADDGSEVASESESVVAPSTSGDDGASAERRP